MFHLSAKSLEHKFKVPTIKFKKIVTKYIQLKVGK